VLVLFPTHIFFANLFSRLVKRKWSLHNHFWFAFGAGLPDLPVLVVGLPEFFKYFKYHPHALEWYWIKKVILYFWHQNEKPPIVGSLMTTVGYYRLTIFFRECMHNVFFWVILWLVLCVILGRKNWAPVIYGAVFFHIAIDWLTHTEAVHAYLWPLVRSPITGFVSHDNPMLLNVEWGMAVLWLLGALFWVHGRIRQGKNKNK